MGLSFFDKINLAACAARRASDAAGTDRFSGEFATAWLWKGHRVNQTQGSERVLHYVTAV